jgi:transcriptional regulator with XRE-family HTH domain
MKEHKSKTFEIDGTTLSFDTLAFKKAFRRSASSSGISLSKFESVLAEKLYVTPSAVHNWRMGLNGPSDLNRIRELSKVLGVPYRNLMKSIKKEPEMEILKDYEREALSRVYGSILNFLFLYSDTDGFVWDRYFSTEMHGQFQRQFGIYGSEFSISGNDLAYESFEEVERCLQREYVNLGKNPIYEELDNYLEDILYKVFDGRLDPDFRFEPHDEDFSDWPNEIDAINALNEIVNKYL